MEAVNAIYASNAGNDSVSVSSPPSPTTIWGYKVPEVADASSLAVYAILGIIGYSLLCSTLRPLRIRRLQARLGYTDRESLSRMSIEDAQFIAGHIARFEMPLFYDLSLRLALLRTYTVENVAKVLVSSSDLAKRAESPKRYEDTGMLYSCWAHFKPQDEGFLKAVARMNFLHGPYIRTGKIRNEDFLYVLWASMADPVRIINLYEWRKLTDMEHAALGGLWKHIGDLMGIDYKAELGHDDWKDGIEFMDEVTAWARKYEDKYMHPYPEVGKLGELLMDLFLDSYPKFSGPAVSAMSRVVMGERMRYAFGFPEPGLAITTLTYMLLSIRKFTALYLSPPRIFGMKILSEADPKTGRLNSYRYMKEPWYNKATFMSRWGPEAWLTWSYGGIVPGSKGKDGADFKPDGFLFEDIGPKRTMGKGIDDIAAASRLGTLRQSGDSPFSKVSKG